MCRHIITRTNKQCKIKSDPYCYIHAPLYQTPQNQIPQTSNVITSNVLVDNGNLIDMNAIDNRDSTTSVTISSDNSSLIQSILDGLHNKDNSASISDRKVYKYKQRLVEQKAKYSTLSKEMDKKEKELCDLRQKYNTLLADMEQLTINKTKKDCNICANEVYNITTTPCCK